MSGSLLEVKKQIQGVENTRKITKAMQLVAASKMRQFQKRAVMARDYVYDLFKILERNISEHSIDLYSKNREEGKTLFVLYTSDKGLCGPLNNKLINAVFRSSKWKNLAENEKLLVAIGKKSVTYAENNKIKTRKKFTGIPEKISNLDAIKIIDEILELWRDEEEKIKEVILIAPFYKNSFTFYPVMKTFLPFSKESIESNIGPIREFKKELAERNKKNKDATEQEKTIKGGQNHSMIFSPDQENVLKRLYEQIIQALFIQSFLELKAAEYSSRMIAMQNATDSADGMISDLKLVFNKARQSAITQEIAELIGASMALADEDE